MKSAEELKISWIKDELENDGFYITEYGVTKILAGDTSLFEDGLIESVEDIAREWDNG